MKNFWHFCSAPCFSEGEDCTTWVFGHEDNDYGCRWHTTTSSWDSSVSRIFGINTVCSVFFEGE